MACSVRLGTYPVSFVDGSGGGDAFNAGYIVGLLEGRSELDCLKLASAVGASCVRAVGTTAGVFTRAEAEEFVRPQRARRRADRVKRVPFAPETQAIRAGRLLLTRIKELAEARQDFGFETTLAGRSYVNMITGLRGSGYRVVLFFLWLPSAETAVARVANRVRQGGHDVPEATIRRRFEAGLRNFFRMYAPLVDTWNLYDGTQLPPLLIASRSGATERVHQPERYQMIKTNWGN